MMKFSVLLLFLVFVSAPFSLNAQGSAYPRNGQALVIQNPQQAARLVQRRFGGKVLKVSKKKNRNRVAYKVKLIKKDGHIISVLVDAQTGRIQG
ncbi:MAG: PepSY domain-containing protein [Alteromonadaceae bacterium]|nr:PepSY domain-containing protein [Alteromonadaceae bacterium]